MPYVYRYKDMSDQKYKYIGIVKSDGMEHLQRRIKQHRKDEWIKESEYFVDYVCIDTRLDAEFIEGHLICKYGTDKFYNKAKANWGISNFIDENNLNWIDFGIETFEKTCSTICKVLLTERKILEIAKGLYKEEMTT